MEKSKISALVGHELADDYARFSTDQGKWAETWDVVKNNFSKIVFINVLVLLFFVPGIAVIIFRNVYIGSFGIIYPFNTNFGVGYPAVLGAVGLEESIILSSDLLFFSLLILMGFIAAIGVSGGAYSVKKLIGSHGEFTVKGFFHGVKVSYFNTIIPVTLFLAFLFAAVVINDWANYVIACGAAPAWPTVAKVCIIIATVVVGLISLWMTAVGVSYKVGVWQTVKNSFVLFTATPIQSIFFAAFALVPVWLLMIFNSGGFMYTLVLILCMFFGFSFILIVWMSYTQWVFDLFITPNIKEKNAKSKTASEVQHDKAEEEKQIAMQLLAAGKSELIGKPILPLEEEKLSPVPKVFRRSDLLKVKQEKAELDKKIQAYGEEHKNDKEYAEYNKMFAEREKPVEVPDKKSKKKKSVSADNLLR